MDQGSLSEYKHSALPSPQQQFRLLTLRPNPHSGCPIDCEFTVHDLPSLTGEVLESTDGSAAAPPPPFEAVSWSWGDDDRSQKIQIHQRNQVQALYITKNLENALRRFRRHDTARLMWIDMICINQDDMGERSMQVAQMNRLYSRAEDVCVWIGESDAETENAFHFMNEIRDIWNENGKADEIPVTAVLAFWKLLNRPWFSRRWVVQEIALAQRAKLFCGEYYVDWQDFGHAVSLFVEYETTTKKYSKALNESTREQYANIRQPFGNASQIGAFILIKATSSIFRGATNAYQESKLLGSSSPGLTAKLPLWGLEQLVTRLSLFQAGEPRDTIYAYLALAKNTTARTNVFRLTDLRASEESRKLKPATQLILRAFGRSKTASKEFRVDYELETVEVFKQFVKFSINEAPPLHALNILCCPWAPKFSNKSEKGDTQNGKISGISTKTSWSSGRHTESNHMRKTQASELGRKPIELPSWIPSQQDNPFVMRRIGGANDAFLKMQRQNADPLAAISDNGQYIYAASGSTGIDVEKIKFETVGADHILSVQGFIFDQVGGVTTPSRSGTISADWFELAGWDPTQPDSSHLPEDFWRTLVANRGSDLGNAPLHFEMACAKAVEGLRGSDSLSLDTAELIATSGGTVVTKFLERVQNVIWERSLMRTVPDAHGNSRLGLVYPTVKPGDDYLCILYGCSVPVILRKCPLDLKMRQNWQKQRFECDYDALMKTGRILKEIREQQLDSRRADPKFSRMQTRRSLLRQCRIGIVITVWGLSLTFFNGMQYRRRLVSIAGTDMFISSLLATSVAHWKSLLQHPILPRKLWLTRFIERADLSASLLIYGLALAALTYSSSSEGRPFRRAVQFFDEHVMLVLLYVVLARLLILSPLRGHTFAYFIFKPFRRKTIIVPTPRHEDEFIFEWWKGNRVRSVKVPENLWTLIGPAYVHGMMDGEAMSWRNTTNAEIVSELIAAKEAKRELNKRVGNLIARDFAKRQTFHLK